MTGHFADWDERTLELAVERWTVGIDAGGDRALRERAETVDLADFELAVAAVHLAGLGRLEAPPAALLQRLSRAPLAAEPALPAPEPDPVAPFASHRRLRLVAAAGWLLAASVLLVVLSRDLAGEASPFELRDHLIATGAALRASWSTTDDPAGRGAEGDVVWSSDRQEGYMRFVHLEPNDPSESQYQLWIFDPTRASWEEKPVDGGVFDVPSDGEVVVPIDAKLPIGAAALFAITLEKPGGVVVSARERLVLTAKP